MMDYHKKFSKSEKRILWSSLVVGLLCLFLLSPFAEKSFFDRSPPLAGMNEIGKISYQSHDTRHRTNHEMTWHEAKDNQSIQVGDAIFSGPRSSARVDLRDKSQVTIGENSLVVFETLENEKVADLQSGNFRLKVDGNLKIAIQGELTEINGKSSDIQVFMGKDRKPKLKLLKGEATVHYTDHYTTQHPSQPTVQSENQVTVVLETQDFVSLPVNPELGSSEPAVVRQLAQEPPPILPTPSPAPLEKPKLSQEQFNFELVEKGLEVSAPPTGFVRTDLPKLTWSESPNAESHSLQISAYEDFRDLKEFPIEGKEWTWSNPEIGQYFVRIKAQRKEEIVFSTTSKIRTLVDKPFFRSLDLEIRPNRPPVVHLIINSHKFSSQTEIQIASDVKFTNPFSKKISERAYNQEMMEPGDKFVRARLLNPYGWPISRFSKVHKLSIPYPILEEKIETVPPPGADQLVSTRANTEIADPPIQPESLRAIPRLSFWGGLGANYLKFSQSGSSDLESGTFAKLVAPALTAGANVRLTDNSSFQFEYHDWPGQITTRADTKIDRTEYHWRSMVGEIQYNVLDRVTSYYSILLGAQMHQVPFLSVNTDGTTNLLENELRNLSVGLKANYLASSNFEYEIFMRYQALVDSQSLNGYAFKAKSGLMFDGSLGVKKNLESGLGIGIFWFGQYQDIKYDFNKAGTLSSGSQSFFNSNIQIRIGYSFLGLEIFPIFRRRRRRNYDSLKK